jgi:hypothetical protein
MKRSCCFCGETVGEQGICLILGRIENLDTADPPSQTLWSHSACLRRVIPSHVPLLEDGDAELDAEK